MIKKFSNNFSKLPLSNKSMVYLMWIYGVGSIITGFFINIYIFKLNNSLAELLVYNIIGYTSILFGFSFVGLLMSIFQKDIKNMYYISYSLFIISFAGLFIFNSNIFGIYLFGVLYGLGNGVFWNAVHTQELKNIENKNRDFYSSSISAGKNIISIINPLFIAITFYLANIFHFNGYTILFSLLPIIYLISFFFIKNINSYIPKKIKKEDFINFFNLKKYKYGHLYFLVGGFIMGLSVIMPIINLIILKNEINIALYQGILTIFSTFGLVHFSIKRKETNRFKYFSIFGTILCLNVLLLGFFFNLYYFIFYSIILLIIGPLYRVSEHVYDLHLMDNIKIGDSDFYPAMLLREVILWLGRIIPLFLLLFFNNSLLLNTNTILEIGLYFISFGFIVLIYSISLWEKNEK